MKRTAKHHAEIAGPDSGKPPRKKELRVSEPAVRLSSPVRTERFEFRLTPAQKAILTRAAELDDATVSQFVVRAAVRVAKRKLLEEQPLLLSERDRAALVNALLDPPAPNEALRAAYRRYRAEHVG